MAFPIVSHSSSSSSSSPALFCPTRLLRLPAALLPQVCSYLSPKELLRGLAQTAKSTRDLLTSACFSFHPLELGDGELPLLAALPPSASLSLQPFHTRVLCQCDLSVELSWTHVSMQQTLAALHHFPVCRSLSMNDHFGKPLPDPVLYELLHHPTALSCHRLTLSGFTRSKAQKVPVDSEPSQQTEVRVLRSKRKYTYTLPAVRVTKRFDWADIRLPTVTSLTVHVRGKPRYVGGAAFLAAHTGLLELTVNLLLVSVVELTSLFVDTAALPLLTRFGLHEEHRTNGAEWRVGALLTALATTEMDATGRPRPLTELHLQLPVARDVFAAAALIPGLTALRVVQVRRGWLTEWPAWQESAFSQLRELVVHGCGRKYEWEEQAAIARGSEAARQLLLFLESIASRPLQILRISIEEQATMEAAAIAQLARCQQLRELSLSVSRRTESAWMDWRDAELFTVLTPGCFSCLRSVTLETVQLSAEAVVAIASAAPQLQEFCLLNAEPGCHPATIAAILAGYCEHIGDVFLSDTDNRDHVWSHVQPADIITAYRSAVAAAGRCDGYRPFTQLRCFCASMCWCTPPSVWHALLSLLQWAVHLTYVTELASNDPLVVAALSYLPSLAALGDGCLWPLSFAGFLELRCELTGRYRFLASADVAGEEVSGCPSDGNVLELHDSVADGERKAPVLLRPHSPLFSAYRRSLSAEQQAVLARWARGDFRADDGRLAAPESELEKDEATGEAPVHCPHPHIFYRRYEDRRHEEEASEVEMAR